MMNNVNDEYIRTLAMLRYQANHYQMVGNGSKSQQLYAEIRRLLDDNKKNDDTSKN